MNEPANSRNRLLVGVEEALDRSSRIGKAMVTFSRGGATHERIGVIERVETVPGGGIRLAGADHASVVVPAAVASIGIDRSSKMKDKVYPRLDFCDAAGKPIFSIVGFEGLEPFDAALAGCREEARGPVEPRPQAKDEQIAAELPAFDALRLAQLSGQVVTISHGTDGFSQEWRGKIAALKPAMGFTNIIDPDFHLHLKDGVLSDWRLESDASTDGALTYVACDRDGNPIGLRIRGPALAFAAVRIH
ncbi:MAG: hypothetical protein AB7O43_17875 [Hyphomicrobiaceae bacterium]